MDLLKVISHHNARLATPIRSVQRLVDESESRSAGFRDMRNSNQAQRRPYLILDSQLVTTSDGEEEDSDASDDISDEISRLSSAQLAKVTKPASTKSGDVCGIESDGSVEERSGLKTPSESKKPKENIPAGDGNLGAGSPRIPDSAQQNTRGSGSVESLLQDSFLIENADSDVHETLMDRIHAGTEERLVKSHTGLPQNQGEKGKATSEQPVSATHVPPAVETPEEKVPHLYSNNVGNDIETAPPETSDDQANDSENTVPSLKININAHSSLPDEAGTTLQTSIDDHEEQSLTLKVNVKHDVGAGNDDPWRQPSASRTSEGNVSDEATGAASPVSSNDSWRQPSTTHGSNESLASSSPTSSDDDLWKQPSTSQVHNLQKTRPSVDPNLLVPGVAIEGPKHTIPLDEDFITRDDSRTLIALGKPTKERRESPGHGAAKGAVSSDTRDTES